MVELVLEADPAAPSPPLSPPSASLAFSLRLSRVVFLIGIATPVVLALVTAPAVTTPPLPPSEEKARPKRRPSEVRHSDAESLRRPPNTARFSRLRS